MRKHPFLTLTFLLFLLFVLGIAWFNLALKRSYESQYSPARLAEMRDFFDSTIEIPEAEPFSEEMVALAEKIQLYAVEHEEGLLLDGEAMKLFMKFSAGSGVAPDSEEWIGGKVLGASDFIGLVREFVDLPDYELEAFDAGIHNETPRKIEPVYYAGLYLLASGRLQMIQHHRQGSLETIASLFRLCRRIPPSRPRLITSLYLRVGSKVLSDLLIDCTDRKDLRLFLSEMNHLEPEITHIVLDNDWKADLAGALRNWKRTGRVVIIPEKGNGLELYRLYIRGIGWNKESLAHINPSSQIQAFLGIVPIFRGTAGILFADAMSWAVFFPYFEEETFLNLGQPSLESSSLLEAGIAHFDLARLKLANRILTIEGKADRTNPAAFVPEFFPEELKDPISNGPYLWDATNTAFYSVAPDGVDGGNRIQYDPTNGSQSLGDISLR